MGEVFNTVLPSSLIYFQVLVQGKNIPPNAIIAGEDKRRPLYVARTFWEVSQFIVLSKYSPRNI